jgi:hypothetical protein
LFVNPRAEAFERLGGAYDVRVLEPSPPAISVAPWFADDPTARDVVARDRQIVSPVTTGDLLWEELAARDPLLADWCADRWLGPFRRLERVPPRYASTRRSLHALARRVIGPLRERALEVNGLRWTRGGFGTPFFGADAQVRMEHGVLVVQSRFRERREAVGTLGQAAELIGFHLSGDEAELDAAPLTISPEAARFAGDFLGFATNVLEQLRADVPPEYEPTRVELWPETFDLGVEVGLEQAGRRATFGASLGDADHPEPYLFVTPLDVRPTGDLWQADSFAGAELPYADLCAAADQRRCALDFVRSRIEALHHPVMPR